MNEAANDVVVLLGPAITEVTDWLQRHLDRGWLLTVYEEDGRTVVVLEPQEGPEAHLAGLICGGVSFPNALYRLFLRRKREGLLDV